MTTPRRTPIWGGLLIALGALAAYANSFTGAFVFDDPTSIADNPSIRHLWALGKVLHPPVDAGRTVGGRPILNLSLAINYALGGTGIVGYHAFNLLIHTLAALILYGIVRRTLARLGVEKAEPIAFGTALLWAVHPLQTEAVTYVVQRAESLMGLFYLLTLYFFIRATNPTGSMDRVAEASEAFVARPRTGPETLGAFRYTRQSVRWDWLSVAACFLGMGTKEVMVSAPVMVFLYDCFWVSGSWRHALRQRPFYYAALAASWILLAALVAGAHGRGGSSGFGLGVSWPAYLLAQFPATAHYLLLSFWPHPLVFDYGLVWATSLASTLPAIVLVAALIGGTIWSLVQPSARLRALGFAGLWFFAILAPSGLIPGGRMTMAEHRMYLALAPVLAVAVFALCGWLPRPAFLAALGVLALAAASLTARRNRDYRSDVILWRETVKDRPENYFALNDYGGILFREGHPDAAIAEYTEASRLAPGYAEVQNNWGMVLAAGGQFSAAVTRYQNALRLKPDYPEAELNLGVALVNSGRPTEALAALGDALRHRPDYAEAYSDLGLALAALDRWPEAVAAYLEAIRLGPTLAEPHNNLGVAFVHLGRAAEAKGEYATAVALKPEYPEALRNLGLAFVRLRDWPEAQNQFERALKISPLDFDAREDLGNVLRAQGRPAEAAVQYQFAAQLQPARAEPPFNLGNALADLGKTDEAVAQYRRALQLAPNYAAAALNLGLALASTGRREEAITAYEQALRINPGYAAAHNNLGNVLLSLRRVDEAIAHYQAAVRLEPDNADARENLAHALQLR